MLTQTVCDDESEIHTGNPAGALIWHASTMAAASYHGYLEQVCEIRQGTQTCGTVCARIQMWTHMHTDTQAAVHICFCLIVKQVWWPVVCTRAMLKANKQRSNA